MLPPAPAQAIQKAWGEDQQQQQIQYEEERAAQEPL
jgi:hypothetical protein